MTDTTANDAKTIAHSILNMKFSDMVTVMNAINQATGAKRHRVDGLAMLKAAQLIIDDKVDDGEPAKTVADSRERPAKK